VKTLATVLAVLLFAVEALAGETSGAGSTFVSPILAKWAGDYRAKTGHQINYQSIGSAGGISQIKNRVVDFGATDMALKPSELRELGLAQFPLVIGGVVPVVNVDGIKPGELRFTGALLADMFLGKVKRWDDPTIQKLNPDLRLPSADITVVHRLDGSGTTFNWVNYLSKVSPEWRDKVGEGTSVEWPIGAAGKGNEGVAVYVSQTKGAISYVEYAFALKNNLTYALVQNRAGRFVKPDTRSFQIAADTADWSHAQDFYVVMTDAPGEEAYPITAATFVLMYKAPKDPERAQIAREFFKWALENGQPQAEALDYVPLPAGLVQQVEMYWQAQAY
jgi:phosphate transport system substrate-binding protein